MLLCEALLHTCTELSFKMATIPNKSLQPNFTEHAIRSGNLLLMLEESHLKEMGVVKIGHRLELMEAIHGLQREVGLVNKYKFINLPQLLME